MNGKVRLALGLSAIALSTAAMANDVRLSAVIGSYKMSAPEAAAAILIADALDLNVSFVISTGRRSGGSLITYGPAFLLAHETRRPFADVWGLRKQGHGWGVVAQRMGMHPGTFNKLRRNGDFDRYGWSELMRREYRWTDDDYRRFESKGFGRGDLICAAVLADGRKDRTSIELANFKKNKSWSVGKSTKSGSPGKSGQAKGKPDHAGGKGHGQGNSKGGGKGKGKGYGG